MESTALPTNQILGIDLGRHRVYVVRDDTESTVVFPMQADHNGLVFRWLGPNGVERVLDHLGNLPANKAKHVSKQTCAMVVDRIKAIDTAALSDRVLLAIPVMPDVTVAEQLVAGFKEAGLYPSHDDLVQRPIASLASWLTERRANGVEDDQLVLAIDNDAGQISAVVADPTTKRLLAMAQVSAGPNVPPESSNAALRALLSRATHVESRFPNQLDAIEDLNYDSADLEMGHVILSGMNTDHPGLSQLIDELAPLAKVWGRGRSDAKLLVAAGLLHMEEMQGWTCPWPTGYVLLDNKVAIAPGVLPLLTDASASAPNEIRMRSADKAIIRLTDAAGLAKPTRLRGEDGVGLRVPSRLGRNITIRYGTDGKISFFGRPNAKPLVIQPHWAVVGTKSPATEVQILKRGGSRQTD